MSDQNLADLLLSWYKKCGRDLPWRVKGGPHPNPYVVLVSEFMLQQTTVSTVIPYFHRFMKRFPTIFDLANATEEDVLELWQGLGYYSRARLLYKTAKIIVHDFNGVFPSQRNDILKLKGIGPYTVASFLTLAFNHFETVIDGNVVRVIARLYHLTDPVDNIKDEIKKRASALVSSESPADYTSAIMDLGAIVCTPKNPQCQSCPWKSFCLSKDLPELEDIPQRKKIKKKELSGIVYIIYNSKNEIFIRKRVEKGLLHGLYEFPWTTDMNSLLDNAENTSKLITHTFTHIKLTLCIYKIKTDSLLFSDGFFIPTKKLDCYALSTLMKKVYIKSK